MRKALGELTIDAWKAGKPLHPSGFWSTRAGDYRAIYEIDADQNRVIVLFIGHRKTVYDNFTKMILPTKSKPILQRINSVNC
ncbi:MAG: type II toxin-antitoxin system RelE/ParE family toxin [Candidatus Bathyarchaeota archaeon]|nr:type II toxin-antitoxin system RelE/ParE family toxin [Candidatus Bathyarchaeota archaeon]